MQGVQVICVGVIIFTLLAHIIKSINRSQDLLFVHTRSLRNSIHQSDEVLQDGQVEGGQQPYCEQQENERETQSACNSTSDSDYFSGSKKGYDVTGIYA